MTVAEFKHRIIERFGFPPTEDQSRALDVFGSFLAAKNSSTGSAGVQMPGMILRGSAGTGKTSLVAAMVQTLLGLKQKVVLMAPTGRAAKVLSQNCGVPASTIHRKIYRQKTGSNDFNLDINLHTDTLFVVDEASMISTIPQEFSLSPSGERAGERGWGMPNFIGNGGGVIDDLVTYVYSGRNCRLLLVGDAAQLPPVGEDEAPALQAGVMGCYGLTVYETDLSEVVRQGFDKNTHQRVESGILWNATMIRQMITLDDITQLPRIRFTQFADIVNIPGNEIIESLEDSYYHEGEDETVVITRSNKTATIYNNGIRARVVDHEGELCSGDRIMIVKNHYFNEDENEDEDEDENENENEDQRPMTFIANGDMAIVKRVRNIREFYGFRFADLTLQFPDYDDVEMDMTAILDTLQSESPNLTAAEQQKFFDGVMEDYQHLPHKSDRIKAVKKDMYYSALQIKFAYAVTCHKAQGGQWRHVYVDQGYMTDDMLTPNYIHWLYTAFTRATKKLFLVNWPETQVRNPK